MKTLGVPESGNALAISQSPATLTATAENKYSQTHFQLRVWYISFLWNLQVRNGGECMLQIQKNLKVLLVRQVGTWFTQYMAPTPPSSQSW